MQKKSLSTINKKINNREFYSLLAYYKKTKDRDTFNQLGEIFLYIGEKLLYSPNFINYSEDWKEDMLSEGLYHCIKYINMFDINREEQNPFAYFTQVIHNGFIQVINKEKKIRQGKQIYIENVLLSTKLEEDIKKDTRFGYDE